MRPVNVGNHRTQSLNAINMAGDTPLPKATEIHVRPGASTETKAASIVPLTQTTHPRQTPASHFTLSEAPQRDKATETGNPLAGTIDRPDSAHKLASTNQAVATSVAGASHDAGKINENNKQSLITKAMLESTKPLFKLLQQVEHDVDVAYKQIDILKSSPNHQESAKKSARAKDLEEFRRQRHEFQRSGAGGDISGTAAYKALKGNRRDSQFESLLPANSAFRHLLDPFTGGIRDVQTGLYAELHVEKESGDLVLVFPGTGASDMHQKQWLTNIAQFSGQGGVPAMYAQAAALANEIQSLQSTFSFDKTSQGGLQLVGHSLGGGIANYVGLKHGIPATCYNAAALGRACLKDLGNISEERIAQQTHIHFKGDSISSQKTLSRLTALLSVFWQVGIVIPRHVGVIYELKPQVWTKDLGFWGRHRSSAFDDHYFPEAGALAYARTLKYA